MLNLTQTHTNSIEMVKVLPPVCVRACMQVVCFLVRLFRAPRVCSSEYVEHRVPDAGLHKQMHTHTYVNEHQNIDVPALGCEYLTGLNPPSALFMRQDTESLVNINTAASPPAWCHMAASLSPLAYSSFTSLLPPPPPPTAHPHCAAVVNISDGGVVFKLPPFGFRCPHMVWSALLSHTQSQS